MKGLAVQSAEGNFSSIGQFACGSLETGAIGGISQQGMAQMGHVDADLVGSSGFERTPYQTGKGWLTKALQDLIVGYGLAGGSGR